MKHAYIAVLSFAALWVAGCNTPENKVDANDINILNMNNDSLIVSVDGKDILGFHDAIASVYLTSGEYKIGVKDSAGTTKEVPLKLSALSDKNHYDVHIVNVDKNRSYVLVDAKAAYFPDKDYEVVHKYFNQDYIEIELDTYHFYWPWSNLPNSIYAVEGSTSDIFKLIEVPSDYKDKSDEEILAYCKDFI